MQNQNQTRNRSANTTLYEIVPWVVYLAAHKARVGGVNYRPVTRRSGPGLYYDLRTGHEVRLSDGTRKPLSDEQACEIVRRIAHQTADGPIDHWFGAGTALLPGGSLATLRSEPDRRAYLVAGGSYDERATPRPLRPDLIVGGLPDGQALSMILGTPLVTYDLHRAATLVRAMRAGGMDAVLYSLPLRTIRERAQAAQFDYLHAPYVADCQAYVIGLVPLGDHWMIPTCPLAEAVAKHVGVERLPVP